PRASPAPISTGYAAPSTADPVYERLAYHSAKLGTSARITPSIVRASGRAEGRKRVGYGVARCYCGARGCAGLAGAAGAGAGLPAAVLRQRLPAAASLLRLSRPAGLSLSGPLALPIALPVAIAAPIRAAGARRGCPARPPRH